MQRLRVSRLLLSSFVLFQLLTTQVIDAQKSTSPWQTLTGDAPLVIARGGFSGFLPDSSKEAYLFALEYSVPNVALWCDVQLTKDGFGICFPDLTLSNASNTINGTTSYLVNGVSTQGWFTIDFSLRDLTSNVYLKQGILSRRQSFDGRPIQTVQDVSKQLSQDSLLWLNVQHEAFYAQQNLSMSSFLLSASRTVTIDYISSPEVNFFRKIAGRFGRTGPKFVFRFLDKDNFEPTTNQTYSSILSNLTFVKTFASGILVPKSYIFPLDEKQQYLLPHSTFLVQDAHNEGLQVFVSGFANDIDIAYNYSFDPVTEYLSFVDNGNFSVDGVLSDFPITASASIDCFSHTDTKQVEFLVISKNGASGDYPGCTNLAYQKAIQDGADVIDCSVQLSSDGKPFCLSSIDLLKSTTIATSFGDLSATVPEISSKSRIYTFNLTWAEIQSLTPAISNPYLDQNLKRNPKEANSGKLLSLSEFLNLAKNSTSLSGVLIKVENAAYLREKQGLDVVKAVLDALTDTGYDNSTTKNVMIQSKDSSVLVEFNKQSKYETVYQVEEPIRDIQDSAIQDIKKFATAIVIRKVSVFPINEDPFLTGKTNLVKRLQKSGLPVYVETFHNEFVSLANDFYSDPTVELTTYVTGAKINGIITEFPFTAARYKRNQCLANKVTPNYMLPVEPGDLLAFVVSADPASRLPAEAPSPVFTEADVTEPPLPPVKAKAPTSTPGTPLANAQAPSGQTRLTTSFLLSVFAMILASLLLL